MHKAPETVLRNINERTLIIWRAVLTTLSNAHVGWVLGRLDGLGVAIVTSPPSQAATSNLGQAMLKRDVCFSSCE